MNITRWLQLDESDNLSWCVRIWTAVNRSTHGEIPRETGRQGYFVTLKLRMIRKLLDRLNEECLALFESAKAHEDRHVCTPENPMGHAFPADNDLKYRLMIDNDSLLFEIDSCCELIKKFLSGVYSHIGCAHDPDQMGRTLCLILVSKGKDPEWFSILDKERNFYIHEGAPYHVVDISRTPYNLIIMKDNLKVFDNPEKFTTLEEINKVVKGFFDAAWTIRDYIVDLYENPNAQPVKRLCENKTNSP